MKLRTASSWQGYDRLLSRVHLAQELHGYICTTDLPDKIEDLVRGRCCGQRRGRQSDACGMADLLVLLVNGETSEAAGGCFAFLEKWEFSEI